MRKFIKNTKIFQGKKYLNKHKNYFEGWYFKNINAKEGISFIPGISINKHEKKAFIQVITNKNSYYIDYSIDDFRFSNDPFYVKIGNNYFSEDSIEIDIDDGELKIYGSIKYEHKRNICGNIMGPFVHIPFMECNHEVICMKNIVTGIIYINDCKMDFDRDIGYIEKDWGCSFPSSYVWCQGNNFKDPNACFMLSIADIPFKVFNFRGLIASLIIKDKEYRFATYNGSKIIKNSLDNQNLEIVITKDDYSLNISSKDNKGHKLVAPVKGEMNKNIYETINASIEVTLKKDDKIIFSEISENCGVEIVNKE